MGTGKLLTAKKYSSTPLNECELQVYKNNIIWS